MVEALFKRFTVNIANIQTNYYNIHKILELKHGRNMQKHISMDGNVGVLVGQSVSPPLLSFAWTAMNFGTGILGSLEEEAY